MPPELVIGPVLTAIGVVLIFFRRSISRILYRGMERMYGAPLADDLTRPGKTPMRMLVVGIFFIGFGIFTGASALLS